MLECVCVFGMSLLAVGVVLPKSSTSAIWGMIPFFSWKFYGKLFGVSVFEYENETSADFFVCLLGDKLS